MLRVPLQHKYHVKTKEFIEKTLRSIDKKNRYYWFSSSGSTLKPGESKWIALTEEALEASAKAVNAHLQVEKKDSWANPLPLFHVGGFGAYFRSKLSGISFYSYDDRQKWCARSFVFFLNKTKATITSVVPTQVYDFVSSSLKAPPFLRAAILGGGYLDEEIFKKARVLGWPLLPSYGMTELASQIATANLCSLNKTVGYQPLTPLPHVKWKKEVEKWCVQSEALFSKIVHLNWEEEKILDVNDAPDWFLLPDLIEKTKEGVRVIGRADGIVKVVGELVNILKVQSTIERVQAELFPGSQCGIVTKPDARRGVLLILFTEVKPIFWKKIKEALSSMLLPFEIPHKWLYVEKIPVSSLGKPLLSSLNNMRNS